MKKTILKEASVLLIAATMIFSAAVVTAKTEEKTPDISCIGSGQAPGAIGEVVWDNGMEYDGMSSAQYDWDFPFESECADDFVFEEDTEVCDVHWVGGYWNGANYNQVHWPWEIIFYYDRGDGNAPGQIYIGPITFEETEYYETIIEDTGSSIYYEISVDLPENYIFFAGMKYWISIQGQGLYPPQCGWGSHYEPIILHQSVFRSEYFGFPDWVDSEEVNPDDPYPRDMCFQLTKKVPCEPSVDVEKYVWDPDHQEWVDADYNNTALDLPICTDATFKIVIHNDGNEPLFEIIVKDKMHDSLKFISGDPDPDEIYYEKPFWYMEWFFPGPLMPCNTIELYITAHVNGPECSYDFNYVLVEAFCCGEIVRDEDYAWVHARCCFDVEIPGKFNIFKLKANVKEICGIDHTNVPWTMTITGGLLFPSSPATFNGTISSISANGVAPINSKFMIGLFGAITVTITIDNCKPKTFNGKILLFFIIM